MAFCVWMCAFPTPSVHSLENGFDTLVDDHVAIYMRAHFWALHVSLLVYVSDFRPLPYCLDDQSFGNVFKSGRSKVLLSLSFQDCSGFLYLLFIFMNWFCPGSAFHKTPQPPSRALGTQLAALPRPFLGDAQAQRLLGRLCCCK